VAGPLKAIRLKCLDCTNNQPSEIKDCLIPTCPLFEFRMGHNPNRKGMGNRGAFQKTSDSTNDSPANSGAEGKQS
jgi:hypothetical protein